MENNKYYDLIIELIQENNKFPGHEDILKDIAEDVYNHAKVVLNSVTNEDVISAYLEKVISTSIITVSKKLNKGIRQRSSGAVDAIIAARKAASEARSAARKTITAERELTSVNTELVDKMINGPETPAAKTEPISESTEEQVALDLQSPPENNNLDILEESELSTDITSDEIIQPDTEQSFVFEENTVSNDFIQEDLQPESDMTAEIQYTPVFEESHEESINSNQIQEEDFVSTELNESPTAPIEASSLTEETPDNLLEDMSAIDELSEIEINTSEISEEEPADLMEEEIPVSDNLSDFETDSAREEEFDTIIEDTSVSEDLPSFEANPDLMQEQNNLLDEQKPELISAENLVEEAEVLEEVNELSLENGSEDLELTADTEAEDLTFTESDLEELEPVDIDKPLISETKTLPKEETVKAVIGPDYSCFSYNPDVQDSLWNEEDVTEALELINKKEPESNVFKIYKLRYNNGYTLDKISKELNITEDQVIDTLIEISLLVKE